MSKRKFGFEGFGLNRPATYNFERSQPPARLYLPPSSRHRGGDHYEDQDLDNIDYDIPDPRSDGGDESTSATEVDPLDAFMEGIQQEIRAPPPLPSGKPKERDDRFGDDEEYDPVESFMRAKKDLGLTLAADALNAGYNSDEEVYAAARAVDAGLLEYDEEDNPVVVDRRKIEPLPALEHGAIEYEGFNKDFYEEKVSISGKFVVF